MTDRELLELAAKAAGIEHGADRLDCGLSITLPGGRHYSLPRWNPLVDDGDALRLAVKLRMDLDFQNGYVICVLFTAEIEGGDYRRAIVRAAAERGSRK